MKLLSIIIPSYNSEEYLANCLDSLLIGVNDKIEVIVVNDGSKDRTSEIAHEYAKNFDFIRVIDKENGGHGSGINVGIKEATGLYFKVLDSDDGLDREGLLNLLSYIEKHHAEANLPDLYLADYNSVPPDGKYRLTSLKQRAKRINTVISFNEIKKLRVEEYFMMHMTFVKTSVLREYNVKLLEKCFYEDNQFVISALMYCKTICYLDKPIYLYTVGRAGQSVSPEKMSKNYNHQLRVMNACIDMIPSSKLNGYDKYQKRAILHELDSIAQLTFFYCHLMVNDEKKAAYKEFVNNFKERDQALYNMVYCKSLLFIFKFVPFKLRGKITNRAYDMFSKRLGWR